MATRTSIFFTLALAFATLKANTSNCILFTENYESAIVWQDTKWNSNAYFAGLSIISYNYGKYLQIAAGANNQRSYNCNWGQSIYEGVDNTEYDIKFDICVNAMGNNQYNSQLAVIAEPSVKAENGWTSSANKLFFFEQVKNEDDAAVLTYTINGNEYDIWYPNIGTWYTFYLHVNKETRTVSYYAIDAAGSVAIPDGEYVLPETVTDMDASTLWYAHARYQNVVWFDNVTVYKNLDYEDPIPAFFTAINPDGLAIRYHKLSNTECEVTHLEGATYSGDITIPASVTYKGSIFTVNSIGEYAFYNCGSLSSITIPNTVTQIGEWAFFSCTSLSSITLPNTVTFVGDAAFSGCTFLTSIITDPTNPNYSSLDGVLFNKEQSILICYPAGKQDNYYTIPSTVSEIKNLAFFSCTSLTSITLPNTVNSISVGAFEKCYNLTSISLPSSLTEIKNWAFGDCCSLTSITLPSTITKICDYAFSGCQSLISINLPNNLISIGKSAFNCCYSLCSIILPSTINSIDEYTFYRCKSLSSVTIAADTPPYVSYTALDYVPLSAATLYVPSGSLDAYQTADGWKYFGTILEFDPESEPDTDITSYDDIIYVNPVEANTGKQVTLSLQMNNQQSFVGFQCDLTLPDGMTFAKDEDDLYLADLSLERTTDKKTDYFNVELQSDGALRFLCSSTKKYNFDGNSGEVATVTINVPADIEDGEYPLILTNIVMTDEIGNTTEISYVKTTLTIFAYTLGDVNADGSVNVGDFAATAAYILGPDVPEGFVEKAADANCDTKINVGDLAAIAAIILGPGANAAPQRADEAEATAEMTMELTASETTGEYLLYVGINNVALPFSGYQFDLVLPQGLTVMTDEDGFYEASLCEDRTNGRRTDYFNSALQSDGALRILCASTQNAMFEGETGHVAAIKLAAKDSQTQGAIELKSAMLTNGGDVTSLDDTLIKFDNSVSNIEQLRNEQSIRVYDLNGQLIRYGKNSEECLKDMPHGVYVVNGVKVVL